jgi:hypothetical protein
MQELVRVFAAAILMASAIRVVGQELPRIPFPDARLKIIRIVQAEPVAGVYANTVTADVIVGLDGNVESVSVIQGQQAQRASALSSGCRCDRSIYRVNRGRASRGARVVGRRVHARQTMARRHHRLSVRAGYRHEDR